MMSNCCKVSICGLLPRSTFPALNVGIKAATCRILEICMHNHVGGTARSTGPNPRSALISLEASSSSKPIIADKLVMSEDPYQLGIIVPYVQSCDSGWRLY